VGKRILIVEDEADIAVTLSDRFQREGFHVEHVCDGESAVNSVRAGPYDLILLDVMLPGMSGFDVCRELRRSSLEVPIIMLTARDETVDKIVGLRLGADDYVTKPFDIGELLARVEALLRRAPQTRPAPISRIQFGDVEVDLNGAVVRRNGAKVELSAREFSLLRYLIEHRGTVHSRKTLLAKVWNYDAQFTTRTVDVHVAWLRQKLEEHPGNPQYIVTVRGLGYKFSG
jgi:two-component system alkaline phosphatase synthesis response regulator PhoP